MKRTLLIARREYFAYTKTVGFWLSLLAFPLFAVLGGAIPILIRTSEPVRAVALVEDGPQAAGLAAFVRNALDSETARRAAQAMEAAEQAAEATGVPPTTGAAQGAVASLSRTRIRFVSTPDTISATTGTARDAAVRRALDDEIEGQTALDAVVFLTRDADGRPEARVWSARASDSTVEDYIRDTLRAANRRATFEAAGIDPAVVTASESFRPRVTVFSPSSASGGEVSFRDKLPAVIGLAGGFLLWSLIITGASILLNSVMEEKSNKILEVLLSSASATEILAGKVLGVALLTITVMLAWGGIGAAGLIAAAPDQAVNVAHILMQDGLLAYFAVFMLGGYLMYAVLFAAIGAFCDTPRDAQTLMGPIMMILVIPIMTMTLALESPDAPVIRILSLIPLFTPFLMMARLPADPPLIEVVGAVAGMFGFALLMVWVSGRAFRAGALSDVKLSWKTFMGAVRGGR
ncbi:ABC transporter permease [Rhizobium sp. CRIBSB]|nr:ABC transporter permease [Rhizobium sp. CRIBSB]